MCPGGGSRAPLRTARVPGIRTGNTLRRRWVAFGYPLIRSVQLLTCGIAEADLAILG